MEKRIKVTIEMTDHELECLSDFASKKALCVSLAAKLLMVDNLEHYGYDLSLGLRSLQFDAEHQLHQTLETAPVS